MKYREIKSVMCSCGDKYKEFNLKVHKETTKHQMYEKESYRKHFINSLLAYYFLYFSIIQQSEGISLLL